MTDDPTLNLPLPADWSTFQRRRFREVAQSLVDSGRDLAGSPPLISTKNASLNAAQLVIRDLVQQGWTLQVGAKELTLTTPASESDPLVERDRVRRQELLKRDEQLSRASVARFIRSMEQPREFGGHFVSIFSLMRDGGELSRRAREAMRTGEIATSPGFASAGSGGAGDVPGTAPATASPAAPTTRHAPSSNPDQVILRIALVPSLLALPEPQTLRPTVHSRFRPVLAALLVSIGTIEG